MAEKRLIYAEDLFKPVDRKVVVLRGRGEGKTAAMFEELFRKRVEMAPTVDAVEVVRCKDCEMWCRNSGIVDSPNGHCFCHEMETNGFDFCSYGERKDNA